MHYRTFTRSGLRQIVALILPVAIFGMALHQPLSIARVQLTYGAVDAAQGLLKITFQVTNNRPSRLAPQFDAPATLDTLAGLDSANDPNTIA